MVPPTTVYYMNNASFLLIFTGLQNLTIVKLIRPFGKNYLKVSKIVKAKRIALVSLSNTKRKMQFMFQARTQLIKENSENYLLLNIVTHSTRVRRNGSLIDAISPAQKLLLQNFNCHYSNFSVFAE